MLAAWAQGDPEGPCHVIGAGRRTLWTAALVNGAVGNVLEMDDVHRTALLHPGPVVVPAALALPQERRRCRRCVARRGGARVRGDDPDRASVGPTHYKYFHNTATCGAVRAPQPRQGRCSASTAAGWSTRSAMPARRRRACGNAGTRHDDETAAQRPRRASRLLAAELAAHGFTGPEQILEGPLGFYAGLCPDGGPSRVLAESDAALDGARDELQAVAGLPAHAPDDRRGARAPRAAKIAGAVPPGRGSTYRDAVAVCDRAEPSTPVEAKFSLQHAGAVVLLRGVPRSTAFDAGGDARAEVAALRAKVVRRRGRALHPAYPAHFGAASRSSWRRRTAARARFPMRSATPRTRCGRGRGRAKARS